MTKYLYYTIVGASLMACSVHFNPAIKIKSISVKNIQNDKESILAEFLITQFLLPYQDTLETEFNKRVAFCNEDLIIQRPSSNLMNWCADAILSCPNIQRNANEPLICLLNKGGLRSSFGAGYLTLQDLYKLMPFDNRLVMVRYPLDQLQLIEIYLQQSGGEPMANCKYISGKLVIPDLQPSNEYIWILTSDFLANGGDQMSFFLNLEKIETNLLLRDIFISEAKHQQTLVIDSQTRYLP